MKLINLSLVQLSLCLIAGIVFAHFVQSNVLYTLPLGLSIFTLFILWYLGRKQINRSILFGICTLFTFTLIGFLNYQIRLPKFQKKHFTHYYSQGQPDLLEVTIKEVLKPSQFDTKYLAEVWAVNEQLTRGKLLLQLKRDSLSHHLSIDDQLVIYASISEIPSPLNPHQFDYSKYMQSLGVYAQSRITQKDILTTNLGKRTVTGRAAQFRRFLINKLQKIGISAREESITQALILGQRHDIDPDLYRSYAAAGAIHILAVSGLHVGIIYFILLFITSPVKHLPFGLTIQIVLIIGFLWGFAFLTGGSPSVIRAVTMFSLFALAKSLNRPTSSINSLCLSLFLLLLINPKWLFHVGFQLSYIAVFAILWIYPKLSSYWKPKNIVFKKLWDVLTVTIAAQLGLLPLSLFYFHQFPGLFFLTNLVILPVLGIILFLGLLIVCLAALDSAPTFLVEWYSKLILLLNQFITWVAGQDNWVVTDVSFSQWKLIATYILIISFTIVWKKYSPKQMLFAFGSLAFLLLVSIWDRHRSSTEQLIVFHRYKTTLLGYTNGQKMVVFGRNTVNNLDSYPIKGYRIEKNSKEYIQEDLPKIFRYKDQTILVIDSVPVLPTKLKHPTLLLTNSPRLHLERWIDSLQPKQIIADGSNFNSMIARWGQTCEHKKIPFHATSEKGSYIFK